MYGNTHPQPKQAAGGQQDGSKREQQYPSTVITVINGRDKVIDFRDNLNPASKMDYAMMHGEGGKDHARVSTIKIVLCDYSGGTGPGNSKTVSCNIDVATVYRLLYASSHFWMERVKSSTQPAPSTDAPMPVITQKGINDLQKAYEDVTNAYKQVKAWVDNGETDKIADVLSLLAPIGTNIKSSLHDIHQPAAPSGNDNTGALQIVSQDKIIIPNKDENGKSLVTKLSIVRQESAQNGQKRTYPWIIKITNARAFGKQQARGGTTFDSSTMSDEVSLSIFVSDEDLYRCMVRVKRFIETWENVFCLSSIQEADTNRLAWINEKMQNQ